MLRSAPVRGFTLIEWMVTLAVLTVLMALAAPSFSQFQRNSQLVATANAFLASLNTARADAMKRGIHTYVTPADGTDWASGWVLFADADHDQTLTPGIDPVLYRHPRLPEGMAVDLGASPAFLDGGARYVSFNGAGYPRLKSGGFQSGRLVLSNGIERRSVVLDMVGRVRVCRTGVTGC